MTSGTAARSRSGRRWQRWDVFVLVYAIATVLLCETVLRLLTTRNSDNGMAMLGRFVLLPYRPAPEAVRAWLVRPAGQYVIPDPELGWTVKPNGRSPDGRYEANAEGARAPVGHRYGARPARGRLRLVTVGDSFTHGDGVPADQTWQRHLERLRPDLEVINLGVPGFGTDQAYLRWRRDGARLNGHVAMLGIWPEDLCRNLNVVRFFLQPAGGFGFLSKPRFVAGAAGLQAMNVPVMSGDPLLHVLTDPEHSALLRHDYWAIAGDLEPRPWYRLRFARAVATAANLYRRRELRERLYSGEDPSGIALTVAIAEAFCGEVSRQGTAPIIALFPMLDLLDRYPDENDLPLARALRAAGLDVIDLGPPTAREVRANGASCCYQADRHLSPEGNAHLARWVLERIAARLPALAGHGIGGADKPKD